MIINGTITQVGQPSEPSGQYQVRYQDIIITDQKGGEWPGRIGSKRGYQVNTPISVTVEDKDDGEGGTYNYFRKYNPQYPDQTAPQTVGGYPKLPRGKQAPQQAAERPKSENKQYDTRNTSIERQAAFKAACEYCGRKSLEPDAVVKLARAGHYFIKTGNDVNDISNYEPNSEEEPETSCESQDDNLDDNLPF